MNPLFDPALYLDLGDGTALSRDDLGPCPCGNRVFHRMRSRESGRTRTVCPRCVKIKPDEVQLTQIRMEV